MAKPPCIEDFTRKLALVLDRLSWSRGQLALKAGVDKSVALRWASGAVMPGEASLVALTASIREQVPDFSRADWMLPIPRFAARLDPGGKTPPGREAAALFPSAFAATSRHIGDFATRYGGLWLLLHASVHATERLGVVGYLAEVTTRQGMLWMEAEGGVLGTWQAGGPVFPQHRLLYVALEEGVGGDSLAFCVLWGVGAGKAMVLDGIASSAGSSLRGPAVATRMIALRLDDGIDPPWREEATRRLARLNAEGFARHLPPVITGRLQQSAPLGPRPMVMAVDARDSLACDDAEIAQGLAPGAAAAIAAARHVLGVPVAALAA